MSCPCHHVPSHCAVSVERMAATGCPPFNRAAGRKPQPSLRALKGRQGCGPAHILTKESLRYQVPSSYDTAAGDSEMLAPSLHTLCSHDSTLEVVCFLGRKGRGKSPEMSELNHRGHLSYGKQQKLIEPRRRGPLHSPAGCPSRHSLHLVPSTASTEWRGSLYSHNL